VRNFLQTLHRKARSGVEGPPRSTALATATTTARIATSVSGFMECAGLVRLEDAPTVIGTQLGRTSFQNMEKQGKRRKVKDRQQSTGKSFVKLVTPHVTGSNPAPATNFEGRKALIAFGLGLNSLFILATSIRFVFDFRFDIILCPTKNPAGMRL
jgi:hypothetical protein